MCLAIPGKIIFAKGDVARVDYGGGVRRDVNISLVKASVGDYVIVHAGFAIQILDEDDAKETLMIFNEILKEP